MIVAPCTLRRHAQQPARDHVDLVINHVRQLPGEPATNRQETQRRVIRWPRVGHLIRRNLQRDEAVVRHVCVQSLNDPIAIRVRKRPATIFSRADPACVSVASNIEPVPRPVRTVLW